jgi:hypothetical protein
MGGAAEPDDVTTIISGVFDVNRRLGDIARDVRVIRELLENDEEEDPEA